MSPSPQLRLTRCSRGATPRRHRAGGGGPRALSPARRPGRLAALALVGILSGLSAWWGGGGALTTPVSAGPPGTPRPVATAAVVSPPPTLPLRFSHAAHRKRGLSCVDCHARARRSTRARDVLLPDKKVCLPCHEEAKVPAGFGRQGNRDPRPCRKCHRRFNHRGFPAAVVWRAPRFRFNHRLHRARGAACLDCHRGVERATAVTQRLHLPKMKRCFRCHKGTRGRGATHPGQAGGGDKRASARCVTCHERLPGGRMRSVYPEGKLVPGPSLPHLQHGPTFRRRHEVAAYAHRDTCRACHPQATCLRCHGGIRRPASIHLGNWILRHGRKARANRQKCRACHTRQRFCTGCHSRMGFNPRSIQSPFGVSRLKRYHGVGWASSTSRALGDNRHAVHARRNVSSCVSCHREADCVRCHARRRVGGLGRSPHPPGFRHARRCRRLVRKNRRACLKCHGFNDPLLSLCR